jgi:hypothetical protein
MQVVNGLREIINILNGQLYFDINTKCKSDDGGVSANTVMWMLYILWLSDTGRSDFIKLHKYRLKQEYFPELSITFIFVLSQSGI